MVCEKVVLVCEIRHLFLPCQKNYLSRARACGAHARCVPAYNVPPPAALDIVHQVSRIVAYVGALLDEILDAVGSFFVSAIPLEQLTVAGRRSSMRGLRRMRHVARGGR